MNEKQVFQVLEFSNCIIRSLHSLLTLKATNTDTDVCGIDHVDIVCSVSNCKCCLIGEPNLNQVHNLSLLLGADSAGQYDISFWAQVNKCSFYELVSLDQGKSFTCDHNSTFNERFWLKLLFVELLDFFLGCLLIIWLQNEYVHLVVEQLTGHSNVHCCFNLVAGEHPKFDSCLPNVKNCISDVLLQLVFDSSGPIELEFLLKSIRHFIHLSFLVHWSLSL